MAFAAERGFGSWRSEQRVGPRRIVLSGSLGFFNHREDYNPLRPRWAGGSTDFGLTIVLGFDF